MSENEDKYIKAREADRIAALARERRLEAIKAEEKQGIAGALNTSEELAAEALALGFDAATALVLPLVPLIQVAWADGQVDDEERVAVLKAANSKGVAKDSPAIEFIEMLLSQKPTDTFFSRTGRVIAKMLADEGQSATDDLVANAKKVAEASGGFLGLFGTKIDANEQALIDDLADILKR